MHGRQCLFSISNLNASLDVRIYPFTREHHTALAGLLPLSPAAAEIQAGKIVWGQESPPLAFYIVWLF